VLTGSAPTLTYMPHRDYVGSDSFTFRAFDGTASSDVATVTLTLTPVNDPPVANAQAVTASEDTPFALTLTATDADGEAFTYEVVTGPAHGALSGTAPTMNYTPHANYVGPDSFTFRAFDGTAFSEAVTATLTVTPVNDPPVAQNQTVTTQTNTPVAITLTGSDVDGHALTFHIVNGPAHGMLSGTAPTLTYTPQQTYSGLDAFTFRASDGALFSAPATVTLAVDSGPGSGGSQAFEWGYDNQFPGRAAALAQLSDAALVSGNSDWSLALKADGSLVAWGHNGNGQLNVPSLPGDRFVHAAAGWQHGIACRTDGTVEEWGNPYGNTEAEWEAQRPPIHNCVQVAAGDNHSAALLADGTIVTWGGRAAVTKMSGVITDATQIASGWYAVIALREGGSVTVFGAAGHSGEYLTPPPGTNGIVRVAASQFSFYAIKSDGTMVAWGSPNTYGQLTPPPSATNLIDVAGGRDHTIALRADGTVIVWGDNSLGQLNVPAGLRNVIAVGGGRYYTQAIGLSISP
jgi:hypothetical protein